MAPDTEATSLCTAPSHLKANHPRNSARMTLCEGFILASNELLKSTMDGCFVSLSCASLVERLSAMAAHRSHLLQHKVSQVDLPECQRRLWIQVARSRSTDEGMPGGL